MLVGKMEHRPNKPEKDSDIAQALASITMDAMFLLARLDDDDFGEVKVIVEKAGVDYSVCLKRDTMYLFLNSVYNHFRDQYRELTKNEFNEL